MIQWEYKTETHIECQNAHDLNKRGEEGWEFCGQFGYKGDLMLFKRPKRVDWADIKRVQLFVKAPDEPRYPQPTHAPESGTTTKGG